MAVYTSKNRTGEPGEPGYGLISHVNHWLTAAAFLAALGIGLVIDYAGLPEQQVFALYDWHMLFGGIVLVYGIWRVGWRIAKGFPPPAAGTPHWQEVAAKAVHYALLAAIVVTPVSGVLMTISGGFDVAVWGAVLVPSIGEVEWLNAAMGAIHWAMSFVILALLALHIGAVLKHRFIDRDATLARMTTGRRRAAPR
ncbi:cytochrome b [Aestuariibius insulae]|uniref:cytochrome b n=1 Tax=Aestuariibius insulae TaxID=2058287 RepID=UPI00345EE1C4